MESGAKGCEVIVAGKLRQQRAKKMKFQDGYMIHSGNPREHYVDHASRSILMRQGVMGVMVNIMLPHDPTGKNGPKVIQPDNVTILEPKQ